MKILYFIRTFNELSQTFVYYEIKGLMKERQEVKVACTKRIHEEQYPLDELEILPFSITQRIWNNFFVRAGLRMYFPNGPLRKGIHTLVTRFQPDVIHVQFGPDALHFIDNYSGRQVPIFITFHGFDASIMLRNPLYVRRLSQLFQRPDVFPIFVSEYMARNVARFVEVPRHYVVYCGTDVRFFSRQVPMPPPEPFTFLQVSNFLEKKGHEYTVQAFARLLELQPGLNVRLILAGGGPLRPGIEQRCRELGVEEKVEFPGRVKPAEVRQLMERAHAFVHHSVTSRTDGDMEGLPTVIMEAMAMELPILSTIHSGIPELVEHGVHGFLAEERAVEPYAHYMQEVLSWGQKPENREKVKKGFEKKSHARQLIGYYREALKIMGQGA
ncbi:MAG: glycosyltransferase family 4 protein [Phaeodactylibacter sp.]|nr:glycosyltransferase family 4 protein [Phaeodactylibacter sp.]